MRNVSILTLVALAMAVFSVGGREQAQAPPAAPPPPLAVANGASVMVAWRLPSEKPLVVKVVIYRRAPGAAFAPIATLDAARLGYTDSGVTVGQAYEYGLAVQLRGQSLSAISLPVLVHVGATERVVFRGGSASRGIFDVTVYSEGRKYVETFVAGSGEEIGDLRKVDGVSDALDFRLGARVKALRLEIAPGKSAVREAMLDAAGNPQKDIAGRPMELTLPAKSEPRERLIVEVSLRDGKQLTLTEGEGFSP